MGKFVNKINFSINEFGFAELDRNWRTENFHLTQLGIPFTRLYYPIEGCGYILLDGKKTRFVSWKDLSYCSLCPG